MRALKPLIVICFLVICVNANALDLTIKKAFDAFIVQHNKIYNALDYVKRFTQFVKIYKFVYL